MTASTDIDLATREIAGLTSPDALASLLSRLGYKTDARAALTPEAVGLAGDSAAAIRKIELLAEDDEQFLRVIFAQPRSLTAKVRNDLVRVLGKSNQDHLIILASDFETLEFVFLDKPKKRRQGPASVVQRQVVPKTISVNRRNPSRLDLRTLRRFTWTCQDALDQFDKLRSVFDAAAYTGDYFQNRGLFADHFLRVRLREDAAWRDDPSPLFPVIRDLLRNGQTLCAKKDKQAAREHLFEPIFRRLGFQPTVHRTGTTDESTEPDYILKDSSGKPLTTAFVYAWDRWLDGPDSNDSDTPDENPGACVVTALDNGLAGWIIVTNGRLWRLFSRHAHARATNFYEVDLVEALTAAGDTDPNEAFRYWWLFLRPDAFRAREAEAGCWLDGVLQGSREYAKRLGDRLKDRIFVSIFPRLAEGFLADREARLGKSGNPSEAELADVFEATLTLLYRLLFLLYAESRDLLPIREAPYGAASLKKLKEEIAEKAGVALADAPERLQQAFQEQESSLYDRLSRLFQAMDKGDPVLNVPTYNGGLFNTAPDTSDGRDHRIARFLVEHKVPDRHLAQAIDRLARDQDDVTCGLVFIDFKSLEVRHLGSIYEGLLEFKLRVAEVDLTTQTEKNQEKYIPLTQAKAKRGKQISVVVRKGEVYLSNDKAERKASGSYYTPDPIVEYIVAQTVGPVLDEKLEALRTTFRAFQKTFERERKNSESYPVPQVRSGEYTHRQWALQKSIAQHPGLVEKFFDLSVLDPAMGSGHFLVEAVDFITDRLLKFLNAFPTNPVIHDLGRTRSSILGSLGEQGVTVDPARLTDINLLKRHVLKRCIYGVDLNPMAVELAKVSLWLDAFTLGAPLSFLDHHLRCGNSLIGSNFDDLEKATSGRLFRLDYEPLLRAIKYVLLVSKVADATAAEVARSVSQYDLARQALSGYEIVFDLLIAEHFGMPEATALVTHGDDLDLNDRERFLKSLSGDTERRLVAQVEALAHRPDRRFFHWEIEFPEVFFGFTDANESQIKHKERIRAGSAGFDVIVGNPPYVRQEGIKPIKPFLKQTYQTYDSTNDLYVYFQEMEIRNLRVQGRMGMIVANKWMRAGYGAQLRDFLLRTGQPLEVIDFGHAPIFPDADTFPCILLMTKRVRPLAERERLAESEMMAACEVPREHWHDRIDLGAFVDRRRHRIPVRLLRREGWSLEPPQVRALLEKIRTTGTPLKDYVGSSPLMGLKTGLNEAFVIDAETRDRLIRESKRSAEVVRPLLRGRDAARWKNRESHCFLITITSSENADWPWSEAGSGAEDVFRKTFPAIHAHFQPFRKDLIKRQDQGRFYWELRSCDYMGEFDKPKIAYQDLAWFSEFAREDRGSLANNTVYFIPTKDSALLAVLNSPVLWWYMWRTAQHGKDEVLRLFTDFVVTLPIPAFLSPVAAIIDDLAEQIVRQEHQIQEFESDVINGAAPWFSASEPDGKMLSWLPMHSEDFTRRLLKAAGMGQATSKLRQDIAAFRDKHRTRQVELLTRQLDFERQLATLVEDAYGLTAEERSLLRSTRPVRDPLDVLEAKIRGGSEVDAETSADE